MSRGLLQTVAVHADEGASFDQLREVVNVIGIAGVSDKDAAQINPFRFQDILLFQTHTAAWMRVSHNRHTGAPMCPGYSAQHLLNAWRDTGLASSTPEKGDPYGAVLNAFLNVAVKQTCHVINLAMMKVKVDIVI